MSKIGKSQFSTGNEKKGRFMTENE
jgi:hypothetical protein